MLSLRKQKWGGVIRFMLIGFGCLLCYKDMESFLISQEGEIVDSVFCILYFQ